MKFKLYWFLFLGSLMLFNLSLYPTLAQEPPLIPSNDQTWLLQKEASPLRFEHLTVEDGLSNSEIMFILQDRDGFMWFGTQDGLNKYDGYKVTVYRHKNNDPYSLSANVVMAGVETRDGNLWFGTDYGGLNRYDKATDQFTVYRHDPTDPTSLSSNGIWALLEDSRGVLWVGTRQGLDRFDPKTEIFKNYAPDPSTPHSLSHRFVTRFFEDSQGTLWVGTRNGLNRYNPATDNFTLYLPNPDDPASISHEQAWDIAEDSRGNLWVATRGGGLNKFDRTTEQFTAYTHDPNDPHSISDNNVWHILADSRGILWAATERGGLNRFDYETEQFTSYQNNPANPLSLSHDDIFWLCEDQSGILWIGSRKRAINKLYPALQRFHWYRHLPNHPLSLNANFVYGILEDEAGILWVATQGGGLNRLDRANQQATYYTHDPHDPTSIATNDLFELYQDKAGILWITTAGGGLNRFDPQTETFTAFKNDPANPHSLISNFITNILPTEDGRFWLGTLGYGLELFDPATNHAIHHRHDPATPHSLSEDTIFALHQGMDGTLWIGTARGGVNRLDPQTGQFTSYQHDSTTPNSLSDNNVRTIYQDTEGIFWFGTLNGLNRFDPTTEIFQNYHITDGLPNESIYGIAPDQQGHLWLSTSKGIVQFDPQKEIFWHYNAVDGLQSNQFNHYSYYSSHTGEIFFGGPNGLNSFWPLQFTISTYLPPVVLTDFQLFNHSVAIGNEVLPVSINQLDQLTLTHEQTVFSFEFAALNYQLSAKTKYQYMMQGFDRDWSPASVKRLATYTNLDPGHYVFKVRATNSDGVLNDTPKTLAVTILPPWWQTWWFRSGSLLVIIGLVIGTPLVIYRWRIQVTEARSRELATLVATRTVELRESEAKYRNVAEQANDGIAILQDWHFKYCNPQFARMIGYTVDEIVGMPFIDIILPKEEITQVYRNRLQGKAVPMRYETTLIHKSGQPIVVEVNAGLMEYDRQPATLVIIRDITEHKQFQQALEAAKEEADIAREKAEVANQAKSIFLANMSHELRSPLNAILGFTQLINHQLLPPDQQEYLTIINHSGEHLLNLINQVLDMSKIEAGRLQLTEKNVDLFRLLNDLEDMFSLKAANKKLSFLFEYGDNIPPYIRTDETKLRQVLINLLHNALKFTTIGGVTIRIYNCRKVASDLESPTKEKANLVNLQFEVIDTGPGIAPEEISYLFQSFVQTETGRQIQEGTGLGLAISHNFVQLMGGELQVESTVGQGSCFKFTLPVRVVESAAKSQSLNKGYAIALESGQPTYRILIADDQWNNRQLLLKILMPLGFELQEAEDGQQVIEKWHQFKPHLIWMDLWMPKVDGFQATKQIKATPEGQNTVIIALTASVLADEQNQVSAAGCDDFLQKPFREAKIFELMHQHLGIRFVHNEDSPKTTTSPASPYLEPAKLAELPVPWLTDFQQATINLNWDKMLQLIDEIKETDTSTAKTFSDLTNNFEYQELLTIIEDAISLTKNKYEAE